MRENADALRLAKEVLLQRYLESLLRLPSLPALGPVLTFVGCRRRLMQMGQLVGRDVFDCAAAYRLAGGESCAGGTAKIGGGRLKLILVRATELMTFFCHL